MAVTALTRHSTAFVDWLHFAGSGTVTLDVASKASVFGRSTPRRHTPEGASERLELEGLLVPLAARLASAVESA